MAIRRNLEFSPSVVLNSMSTYAIRFWRACGTLIAKISSFLTFFDFDDMLKAAEQLWKPIWETLTSWVYFFTGYISEMKLYDHPYLVTAGSIIIISILWYIAHYFDLFRHLEPLKDFISQYIPETDNSTPNVDQSTYYPECSATRSPRRKNKNQ